MVLPSLDSDNDGVPDETDFDDDNDGILDEDEANNCKVGDPQVGITIFSEDFGAASGVRVSTPYINYAYEDGTGSAGADVDLQDGNILFLRIYWLPPPGHRPIGRATEIIRQVVFE